MPLCLTTRNLLSERNTVLVLLSISGGLVELADDEGRSARNDLHLFHDETSLARYSSLAVHDSELDRDLQTLPVHGGLLDVVTDLLGGLSDKQAGRKPSPYREDQPWGQE